MLGFGIALAVIANILYNSGEGLVKAISDTTKKNFGKTKIVFDICWVVIAAVLSWLFFGKIVGIREGTLIAALLTGWVVNLITKPLNKPLNNLLRK